MRIKSLIILLLISFKAFNQELFVLTEPASNMPAKSIGIRTMNSWMKKYDNTINYHLMPEIMVGINKNLMVHAQGFISDRNNSLATEGGGVYAKYRFLSTETVHKHFRMAVYGRASLNNSDIHQDEIETMGQNSGYEVGLVATQLLNKYAINASVSFEKAFDNASIHKYASVENSRAINYTLSFGKLLLPKEYTSYKQTNVNFMVEFLGQSIQSNNKSFIDIAPAVQFIINSVARVDFGYRKQLFSNMVRSAPNGFILKFEYTFFNVFK